MIDQHYYIAVRVKDYKRARGPATAAKVHSCSNCGDPVYVANESSQHAAEAIDILCSVCVSEITNMTIDALSKIGMENTTNLIKKGLGYDEKKEG